MVEKLFTKSVPVCSLFPILANVSAGRFKQNLSAFTNSQTRFPSLRHLRFYLPSRTDLHFHNGATFTASSSPEEVWQWHEPRC